MKEDYSFDDPQAPQPPIGGDIYVPQEATVPQFLHEFSKAHSQEERDMLAGTIRERRRERDRISGLRTELSEQQERLAHDLTELEQRVAEHNSKGFFGRVADYVSYKRTQREIAEKLGVKQTTEEDIANLKEDTPQHESARRMIADFYDREKRRWTEAGYTKQDVERYFTEEQLSSLSLEDYTLLLRRFPGQMVSHVTRQGIRDHVEMFEHTGGYGKQHEGFKGILESRRVLSPLGAALSRAESLEDVRRFLNDGKDEEEEHLPGMVRRLKNLTNERKPEDFNDKTAVHVAVEGVLSEIYGGERGNETFVAYPSAFVAARTKHSSDPFVPQEHAGSRRNDVWVWPDERDGMSVDAGVVFIPENAMVDAETGSLYALDAQGEPIPLEEDGSPRESNQLYLKRTEHPVRSRDYWEGYFTEHPDQRPSKMVYYDANDSPTAALWRWKADKGIVNKEVTDALGFTENRANERVLSPDKEQLMRDFNQLAVDALVDKYPVTTVLGQYHNGWSPDMEEMKRAYERMYKIDGRHDDSQ